MKNARIHVPWDDKELKKELREMWSAMHPPAYQLVTKSPSPYTEDEEYGRERQNVELELSEMKMFPSEYFFGPWLRKKRQW